MKRYLVVATLMFVLGSPGCEEATTQLLVMPGWQVGQADPVAAVRIQMSGRALRALATDDELYCGRATGCAVSSEARPILLAINFDRVIGDIGGRVAWRLSSVGEDPTTAPIRQAKLNVGRLLEDPENMANPYAFDGRLSVSFELGTLCREADTDGDGCLPCDRETGCAFDLHVEVCDDDGPVNITWLAHYGVLEGDYPTKLCEDDLAACEAFSSFVSATAAPDKPSICQTDSEFETPIMHYLDPAPDYPVVQTGNL
ncbi:MAG: hypothetical protein VX589_05805 [Myxococcota bacterium]|nr:hypothetical protein [Myxococcota bacterium]